MGYQEIQLSLSTHFLYVDFRYRAVSTFSIAIVIRVVTLGKGRRMC